MMFHASSGDQSPKLPSGSCLPLSIGQFVETRHLLARHVLQRDFKNINTNEARIFLIEGQDRLLSMYDRALSDYTRKTLEGMGVTVKLGSQVAELKKGEITLKSETIRAANIVWA